jgi:pimeloyl-ACP methyl ester carboxylesterase
MNHHPQESRPAVLPPRSGALGMISFGVAVIGLILAAVALYVLPTAAGGTPVTGLFGDSRVGMLSAFAAIGVGLIATTAGGLDPARMLLPMLPARLSVPAMRGTVAGLRRGGGVVDLLRRVGAGGATVLVDRFAFGADVPESYVEFVDEMLSATPFEVVADFFPSLRALDKFDAVEVLGRIPTSIICGTDDKLTSIGHSRKLHARIPDARLTECEGAGHMVSMEQHDRVNAELDQLITSAVTAAVAR